MRLSVRLNESARAIVCVLFACMFVYGCSTISPQSTKLHESWPGDLPSRAELTETPFFPQREYQCGPAALATVLAHSKVSITPDELVSQVYIPRRRGSVQIEMLAAARRYGTVSYTLAPRYDDVLREITAGTPVVVLLDFGVSPVQIWHYAVAVGYDADTHRIILRSAEKERLSMPFSLFEYLWKRSDYWAMVAVPPDRIPKTADRRRYLEAIIALEHIGQPRAAARAYAAFLERWPKEITASIGLANAHYALGELDLAEAALRSALELQPGSVILLNNLAQTLSDAGRGAEALELIDRVAEEDSQYGGAINQTRALIRQRLSQP
jgi:Peptidase_C39 like family/Tetratricopeptide repeat